MTAGQRTTSHWRVGSRHYVFGTQPGADPHSVGVCVSVTPWGKDKIRWVRLRFEDGTERSYAPSHLQVVG